MQLLLTSRVTPARQWLRQGSRHLECVFDAPRRAALHSTRWLSASASNSGGGEVQQPPAPLRPGEVHLFWLTPADVLAHSPSLLDAYRHVLSPAELAHVDAAGAAADVRTERLLSRSLARLVLARYCRTPAQALRMVSNAHGKPFVEGHPGVHFSVAHSPGALLCAVSGDGDVGVDVELQERTRERAFSSLARLARRYFSATEQAELAGLPDETAQRARFLELWTLKEAYVKALGRGIAAAPLSGFSVSLAPGEDSAQPHIRRIHLAHGAHASPDMYTCAATHTEAGGPAPVLSWHFQLLLLNGDRDAGPHVAAVCCPCVEPEATPLLRCWRVLPSVRDVAIEPGTGEGAQLQLLAQGLAPVRTSDGDAVV